MQSTRRELARRAVLILGWLTWAGGLSAATPDTAEPLLLEGRFHCAVRRAVLFPFGGVVDELLGEVSQAVTNGQALVRYRLFPDAAQQVCRRLAPSLVSELEVQRLQTENRLAQLDSQLAEARGLAGQNLTPPAQVAWLERETAALRRQAEALRTREVLERRLAEEDAAMLQRLLATPLSPLATPSQVWLTAPLDGRIIALNPRLAPGAEVAQYDPALDLGVMDPMILRAEAHEREAVRLRPGDAARVTAGPLPGRNFTGTVRRVSWAPATQDPKDPPYFEVEVEVANPDLSLKEGFQGRLEIAPR